MAKKQITTSIYDATIAYERALPPPLDKPMETFNRDYSGTLEDAELKDYLLELIERVNALAEVVKRLGVK